MRARIDDAADADDDGDGDDGGDGRKGRRRRARRERAVVMMGLRAAAIAVVMMRGAEGGTPTCAYAARRETCGLGARRAAFDVVGDARCDAIEGDATCAMRSNGVVFEPTSTRRAMMTSRGEENGAMALIGEGDGTFTIEMRIVPDFTATTPEERQPLLVFSLNDDETSWAHTGCFEGYYMSIWIQDGFLSTKMRVTHSTHPFECSWDDHMRRGHMGIPRLSHGDLNHVALVYDAQGIRLFLNGTKAFPPVDWFFESPGGDAVSTWNASRSRIAVGAYGDDAFAGIIYGINIYDYALSDDELAISANASLENSKPFAISQNVTCEEDDSVDAELVAYDADGDDVWYRITSLPKRGHLYDVHANGDAIEILSAPHSLASASVRFAPAPNDFSIEGNATALFDYDSFEFDVSDGTEAFGSAFVHIRVTNVNDAPVSTGSNVIAYRGVPAIVRLVVEDIDATCPQRAILCRGDRVTSVHITREPALGSLYACDDVEGANALRTGANVTSPNATCLTYVSFALGESDSVAYVVVDENGALSDQSEVMFFLKTPCALLDRTQTVSEDEGGIIRVTAACVGESLSSLAFFATVTTAPRYGEIVGDTDAQLSAMACSSTQNATCQAWAANTSSFTAIGHACACGSFTYVPERDYFNIPSVDVYGVEMSLMGTRAENWNVGRPDTLRMSLKTSNGWTTDPYAAYVFVRNRPDAPTIRIDQNRLNQIERITPNTTSFVLSGIIDIDTDPDYDAYAMSVKMWSPSSTVLEVRDARAARLAPIISSNRRNRIDLIGPPSEIAALFRQATIAYVPRDTNTAAFEDTVKLRVAVGVLPTSSCENLPADVKCFFQTTVYAQPCASTSPLSTPCLIERTIYVPVGDSPSHIARVLEARVERRSVASRRRAVFLIWFVLSFLTSALASRLKRAFCTIARPRASSTARDVRPRSPASPSRLASRASPDIE
jgi:hypothetical protein